MQEELVNIFPTSVRAALQKICWEGLEEIRVRIGWPIEFIYDSSNRWLRDSDMDRRKLDEMLNYITGYSVYAMEEELKQGYITLDGGHRVGVTGHATHKTGQHGECLVTNMLDIGGLNIRIAHEKKGCAKELVPHIRNRQCIYNTIFFAAPGVGKTTYLRDTIRILSSGDAQNSGIKCCVVDERSEIAACRMGKPQNDMGTRTDVLDACPKEAGMRMVLRTMSPQIIAVDELGKETELEILESIRCSGVNILGTAHAGSLQELFTNPIMRGCAEMGIFERYVQLIRLPSGKRSFQIYDGQGNLIWKK